MTRTLFALAMLVASSPVSAQFALPVTTSAGGEGRAVAATPDGGLLLAGEYSHSNFGVGSDFDPGPGVVPGPNGRSGFVARYTEAGALDWVWAVVNGASGTRVFDVDARSDGGAVAAGRALGTFDADPGPGSITIASGSQLFVVSLAPDGTVDWAFSTPQGRSIVDARGVAASPDGSVLVTGRLDYVFGDGAVDFDPGPGQALLTTTADCSFLASYAADGSFQWAVAFAQTGVRSQAADVAADASGIYVTGEFVGTQDFDPGPDVVNRTPPSGSSDAYVARFSSTGALDWVWTLDAQEKRDTGAAVTPDGSGGAFFAGTAVGSEDGTDYSRALVAHVNAAGTPQWQVVVGSAQARGEDAAFAVAATATTVTMGGVYTDGAFDPGSGQPLPQSAPTDQQAFTATYDASTGAFVSAQGFGGPDVDRLYGLAARGNGTAAAGTFKGTTTFPDGTTLTTDRNDPFLVLYGDSAPSLVLSVTERVTVRDEVALLRALGLLVQERVAVRDAVGFLEGLALLVQERVAVRDDVTFLEGLALLVQERIGVMDEVELTRALQLLVREAIAARDALGIESPTLAFGTQFVSVDGLVRFPGRVGLPLQMAGVEGMGEVTVLRLIDGGTGRLADALDDRWQVIVEETLSISPESAVRIDLATVGSPDDPSTLSIQFQPTGGDAVTLPTTYNAGEEALVATGITGSGEIRVVRTPVAREDVPEATALHPPFPNPAASATTVRFDLAAPGEVRVVVYDALGRQVAVLAQGARPAGRHEITVPTARFSPGTYVVRFQVGDVTAVQTFVVAR